MKKWDVEIRTIVQAPTREKAWDIARELCERHLRDLANVWSVSMEPLPDPDDWIAVNEPIKAKR